MSDWAPGEALAPGSTLTDGLVIGEVLRRTARCLVYRGRDEARGLDLAVEEYFPRNLAVRRDDGSVGVAVGGFGGQAYTAGLERFVDETRRLARIAGAAGLPQLRDALQGGGTAYRITDLLDGIWLEEFLARRPEGLPRAAALRIVGPVLDALDAAHSVGLAHGAVGPGTIVLCRNGAVALLDFEGVGGPADDVRAAGALLARLVRGAAEAELEAHEREALAVAQGSRPGVRLETVDAFRRALAGEPMAEAPASSVPERAPLPGDDGKTRLMTAPPAPPVASAPPPAAASEATRLMMPSDFAPPVPAPAAAPSQASAPPPVAAPEATRLMMPSDFAPPVPAPAAVPSQASAPPPVAAPEATRLMTPSDFAAPVPAPAAAPSQASAPPPVAAPEATRLMTPSDFAPPVPAPAAAPSQAASAQPPPAARGSVEKTRLLFSFEPPPARPAPSRPSEPPDPDQILTRILEP